MKKFLLFALTPLSLLAAENKNKIDSTNKVGAKTATILNKQETVFLGIKKKQDISKVIGPKNNRPPYNRIFPLLGKAAYERGYDLPNTYGINFIYVDMKQDVNINKLNLNGTLDTGKLVGSINNITLTSFFGGLQPISLDKIVTIKADKAKSTNTNTFVKADMWVFPFLNVYGILGKTQGKSVANIQALVDIKPVIKPAFDKFNNPTNTNFIKDAILQKVEDALGGKGFFTDLVISAITPIVENTVQQGLVSIGQTISTLPTQIINSKFTLDYDGITYGAGMVLAGGYKNLFSLVDINYTRTQLNIIEGEISALVISPKIGFNFNIKNTQNSIWIGSMFQNITQTLKGDISNIINVPGISGKFEVHESSTSPWNTVLGFRTEINNATEVITEFALNKKKYVTVSLGYRF